MLNKNHFDGFSNRRFQEKKDMITIKESITGTCLIGGIMRKNKIVLYFCLILSVLLCSSEGFAAASDIKLKSKKAKKSSTTSEKSDPKIPAPCTDPEELSFVIKTKPAEDIISNFTVTNPTVTFCTSTKSACMLEWDFGDGQKFVQKASENLEKSHPYDSAGIYVVTLTALKECNGDKSDKKKSFNHEVTVFDSDLLQCNRNVEITEKDARAYRIDALIHWIKTLHKDIAKKYKTMREKRKFVDVHDKISKIKDKTKDKIKDQETKLLQLYILGGPVIQSTFNEIIDMDNLGKPTTRPTATPEEIGKTKDNKTKSLKPERIKDDLSGLDTQPTKTTSDTTNADIKQKIQRVMSFAGENIFDVIKQNKEIELAEDKAAIENCNNNLATLEFVLRKRGNFNLEQIKAENDLKQTAGISKDEIDKIDAQIDDQKARVEKIKLITRLTNDDLFQTFDDYDDYFFRFNIGYEYTGVNKLFQKGFPRIGFLVYKKSDEKEPDDYPGGWKFFHGYHLSLSALVTSSGEQETTVSSNQPTVKNTGENQALEFNMELFTPVYRSVRFNNGKLWQYFGPVVVVGEKKVDVDSSGNTINHIDSRFYGGLKLAINPELYADFLYGKTSRLHSTRVEIRGQLPIYRFQNGSRFVLGAIGNIGVKDKVDNEADDIRIYITWNVNFDKIYEYFSGKQMNNAQTQ